MACGRRKNLEIAARNLLCSHGDRRRNFPTTRDGNRRRGSPEPPGKRGTRKEEPRATGAGKTSKYVAEGKPRVVCGEESSKPPGKGKTSSCAAEGKPRVA